MALDLTDVTQIVFFITSAYIILTMVMALTATRVMQATYWLILMLIGVGVIFLLANSEIIFAFQISIYGGGIAVLLLFAVLLTEHDEKVFPDTFREFIKTTWSQILVFLVLLINMIVLMMKTVTSKAYLGSFTNYELGDTKRRIYSDLSTGEIGAFDVTRNYTIYLWDVFGQVIPFLGLLFLAAILGSIKLVIREWEIEDLSEAMRNRLNPTQEEKS